MKNLIIIGARGFGREVHQLAKRCSQNQNNFVIKGFLDDKYDALNQFDGYPPIIDSVENYTPQKDDVFICALGNVHDKIKYSELIQNKGGQFVTLVNPKAVVPKTVKLGVGCIIDYNAAISPEVEIGNFVTIMLQSVIGHDCTIGDWCHLSPFVFLGGHVLVEEKVQIHTRATVLPGIRIGENSTLGAGSVVISDVKPGTTVFGNPAKKIK